VIEELEILTEYFYGNFLSLEPIAQDNIASLQILRMCEVHTVPW
jgi:hypothetical protein